MPLSLTIADGFASHWWFRSVSSMPRAKAAPVQCLPQNAVGGSTSGIWGTHGRDSVKTPVKNSILAGTLNSHESPADRWENRASTWVNVQPACFPLNTHTHTQTKFWNKKKITGSVLVFMRKAWNENGAASDPSAAGTISENLEVDRRIQRFPLLSRVVIQQAPNKTCHFTKTTGGCCVAGLFLCWAISVHILFGGRGDHGGPSLPRQLLHSFAEGFLSWNLRRCN